ncbi:unnamed protein product [Camellia sinensis]
MDEHGVSRTKFSMGKEDPKIVENKDTVVTPSRKSVVKPVDQWAFLDEIEAPMWIDLDLEAAFGYKDNVPSKFFPTVNICIFSCWRGEYKQNIFFKASTIGPKIERQKIHNQGLGTEKFKSVSTITSKSGEQQHRKLVNVSSQIVSRMSGLLSSEICSSNIKRRREKLLEEARESVPEPGFGRVMHLVKAFEKLFMISKDSDQRDKKQSEDVGDDDDDDDKKGMKWALPGLQQPKVPETLVSSFSLCLSDFFVTSESLGLDSHVSSSLDGSHGSFTISNRTSGGGHRSRRNSSESSGTFGGSHWKKKQLKATYQKPFKLRTEQKGRYKEEESVKKLQQMMMEEEKQRIPIAQGLPWTMDEPVVSR